MLRIKSLVGMVYAAVKELKERTGSAIEQIFGYIQAKMNGSEINQFNMHLALQEAVQKGLLKKTIFGKYKLNVKDMGMRRLQGIDDLREELEEKRSGRRSCRKRSWSRSTPCRSRRRRVCRKRAKSDSVRSLRVLIKKLAKKSCKPRSTRCSSKKRVPKKKCMSRSLQSVKRSTENTQTLESEEKSAVNISSPNTTPDYIN
uniref:H15 domain-containing protein n=2 Tax=Clastoptera arizonana TaxID=38151 RepID=A0A1B6C4S5_9HEMI